MFWAQTIHGRTFAPEEDRPGGDRVVVLSKGLWETRFAADPAIVGLAISLGGFPHTVTGVLGDFNFQDFGAQPPQVWVPFQFDPNTADHGHYFQSAGRLKDGVPLDQARARMRLSIAGVVIGLAASWALAQLMRSFLFDVEARDPLVFVGVPVLLTGVAFLAVWFPALRAARVDPMVALRYE